METLEAIHQRRSVRSFTGEIIADSDMEKLFKAAQIAPSWANTQACRYISVKEKEQIKKIEETFSERNPARRGVDTCSHMIVCCAQKGKAGFKKGVAETIHTDYWYMFDAGLGVQNIALAACDLGYGSVIVGSMDQAKCAAVVGLPDDLTVVCVLVLGVPDEKGKTTQAPPRVELGELVSEEKWKSE